MGCGIVRAARILVLSWFGKFLLEDVFGVRGCEDLQDLECIPECRSVGVVAETPLAAGFVAAVTPALPEKDYGDQSSEEPKTECDTRIDQDATSIAPGSFTRKHTRTRPERCPGRMKFSVGVLGGVRGWRELKAGEQS